MFLVINHWNRMEGGGNCREDEGGFLQPTSMFFLSDTTHRCMLLKNRWSGNICRRQMVFDCLHNEPIFFFFFVPHMWTSRRMFGCNYRLFDNMFYSYFYLLYPSCTIIAGLMLKRIWQTTVKQWKKTHFLAVFFNFQSYILQRNPSCCESVWHSSFSCSPLWLTGCKVLLVEIVPLWLRLCVFKGELGPVAWSSLNSHRGDRSSQRRLSDLQACANGPRAKSDTCCTKQ